MSSKSCRHQKTKQSMFFYVCNTWKDAPRPFHLPALCGAWHPSVPRQSAPRQSCIQSSAYCSQLITVWELTRGLVQHHNDMYVWSFQPGSLRPVWARIQLECCQDPTGSEISKFIWDRHINPDICMYGFHHAGCVMMQKKSSFHFMAQTEQPGTMTTPLLLNSTILMSNLGQPCSEVYDAGV